MSSLDHSDRDTAPIAFLPVFLANLLPLVGVVWFEWEPAALAFVTDSSFRYWPCWPGAKH